MRWIAALKQPIPNGDKEKIYKVMMEETESGVYIYLYVWPNTQPSYEISDYKISKDITLIELCFPTELKSKVESVEKLILTERTRGYDFYFQDSLWELPNGGAIILPKRVFIRDDINCNFEDEDINLMIHCLMTRHENGFVREKHVKYLLSIDYPEWCIPYIFELSTEYVIEILELIHDQLKDKNLEKFKEVLNMNPANFSRGYGRMRNHWFVGYRYVNYKFDEYVGYDLFYHKYGFTREKDYKVKRES